MDSTQESKPQIALIGLGTMGENLALNLADKGFKVGVFNRTYATTEAFLSTQPMFISGHQDLLQLIAAMETPRTIISLIKSGQPVDDLLETILPQLAPGDVFVDMGNSHWKDTQRRQVDLQNTHPGIHYVGCGISGGSEGARKGPSIMPGGSEAALDHLMPFLVQISAKDFNGGPCVTRVGSGASGHFVKMVHNGIEYGLMQGISEVYDILRKSGKHADYISDVFRQLNSGLNTTYLHEITHHILSSQSDGQPLIDVIVPKAEGKGTGTWTVQSALDLGVPVPTLAEAVFARTMSQHRNSFNIVQKQENQTEVEVQKLFEVLMSLQLVCYMQGINLIEEADKEFGWGINLHEIQRIWQGGCIIRSNALKVILDVIQNKLDLQSFIDPLEYITSKSVTPIPVLASALQYLRALQTTQLPANMIQAQRDYFGAHTYLRTDKEGVFTGGWAEYE